MTSTASQTSDPLFTADEFNRIVEDVANATHARSYVRSLCAPIIEKFTEEAVKLIATEIIAAMQRGDSLDSVSAALKDRLNVPRDGLVGVPKPLSISSAEASKLPNLGRDSKSVGEVGGDSIFGGS